MTTSLEEVYQRYESNSGVSTDTRSIRPGDLFVALVGPNHDANHYAAKALASGASYAIVDRADVAIDERYILVDNGLSMLQSLARLRAKKWSKPIIGLTGSNGKTTTKELLSAVLSVSMKVASTPDNNNNHIGVPLTILNADTAADLMIVEMGTNQPGDIELLCDIAQPNLGLITNIGLAHLERLGSPQGIFEEKTALFRSVVSRTGRLFLNVGDQLLQTWPTGATDHTYAHDRCGYGELIQLESPDGRVRFKVSDGGVIPTNLSGDYNMSNIAAALTVAHYFDIPEELALNAIATYEPHNQRSQVMHTDRNVIIADAYNANPSSMGASIQSFASTYPTENLLVIAGDMLELGDKALVYHREVLQQLKDLDLPSITVGPLFQQAGGGTLIGVNHAGESKLVELLSSYEGKTILIKGSRSMRLERLYDIL
ncbi:MAG: UDP-N-acetylmuramoyl-tripeptide--D-alanyl-D-alanine ligase [Bacteroidota bacterium]